MVCISKHISCQDKGLLNIAVTTGAAESMKSIKHQ